MKLPGAPEKETRAFFFKKIETKQRILSQLYYVSGKGDSWNPIEPRGFIYSRNVWKPFFYSGTC